MNICLKQYMYTPKITSVFKCPYYSHVESKLLTSTLKNMKTEVMQGEVIFQTRTFQLKRPKENYKKGK